MYKPNHVLQSQNKAAIISLDVCGKSQNILVGQGSFQNTPNLTLWSLDSLEIVDIITSMQHGTIKKACCTQNAAVFISSASPATLYIFEQKKLIEFTTQNIDYNWLDSTKKTNHLLIAGKRIELWDTGTQQLVWRFEDTTPSSLPKHPIAAISSDGTQIAIARSDSIIIHDLKQSATQEIKEVPLGLRWMAFDPYDRYLAIIRKGIFIWDLQKGERHLPDRFNDRLQKYFSLCFHPDGEHIAFGMSTGAIITSNLLDGERKLLFSPHKKRIWDLDFTQDGKHLVTGGDEGVVYVWDLE